jgi:NAD(P) transhydrogenase subunit alpha
VALVPDGVARLVKRGMEVAVEHGAGTGAGFSDQRYSDAGATIVADRAELWRTSDVVAAVERPELDDVGQLRQGAAVIALMRATPDDPLLGAIAARGASALALELVPRITRAQSMDILSSQSTVAGYRATLIGAMALGKFLPMLTTAAGNMAPARVFVIGAGVAGLQAIATARRLGAQVSAFDIRAVAREQVQSLGATFVADSAVAATNAEAAGGYARAQGEDERERTIALLARHIAEQDLVITTAQVPGRPAPKLITRAMVESMRPGSVIVDLAAEAGGNCELTKPGETVVVGGVTIIGTLNLPATLPVHASQMFSRNVLTLLEHLVPKDGALKLDAADEITGAMTLVLDGQLRPR